MELTLRNGQELHYDTTLIMGIINVTPDSFFSQSRCQDEQSIRTRVRQIIEEGGDIIDVGAYSSRPEGDEVSEEEELSRLKMALPIIKEELSLHTPNNIIPVSVDTFRASVARTCVLEYGADMINDISGGTLDEKMLETVAELNVPYVLLHMRGTPQTMQQMTDYPDGVTNEVMAFFRRQIEKVETIVKSEGLILDNGKEHLQGNIKSCQIILDPGFGFAKTIEQNYQLFSNLSAFKSSFPQYPLLVGISRKSMIYKLLEGDADKALNGTTVLNALAVASGADILRVHDVKEAKAVVTQLSDINKNDL